jgi:hypothetical protein
MHADASYILPQHCFITMGSLSTYAVPTNAAFVMLAAQGTGSSCRTLMQWLPESSYAM